jgi:ABC-type bacteriocin/lantibiotic exporter with double-glycine peptidase domain
MFNGNNGLLKTYFGKWLLVTFLLLLIQQIIASSSTFFLTKAVYGLNHDYNFRLFLYLYLASLLLPYLPGAISRFTLSYNVISTLKRLYDKFIASNYGQPLHFLASEERDRKVAIFSKEYLAVSQEVNYYLYDLVAISLNILLNFVAIIIWVDRNFFIGYLCSLLLCIIALKIQKKYRENYNENLQNRRVSLTSTLIKSWDNIIIGNKLPYDNWKKNFFKQFNEFGIALRLHARFSSLFSVLISFISFAPIFIIFIIRINDTAMNKDELLILLGITPRIFLLLNNTENLINSISYFPGYKIQVSNILSTFHIAKENDSDYQKRIKFDSIVVKDTDNNVINSMEFLKNIDKHKVGLFKIIGDNGSGKTSLLMLIKNTLGDKAFILPAHHNLEMITDQNKHYSTGEKMSEIIKIIFNDQAIEVMLLDEWDANLDRINNQKIISELQELSKTKLIVEVSHKHQGFPSR